MAQPDNNRFIQALFNSGADAFSNMYDVYISPPGDTGYKLMTVRADSFNVPEAAIQSYEKVYHGNKISAPKPEQAFDRKFSLSFRMDAYYGLHDFFLKWQSACVNPNTGGVSNIAPFLGKVEVRSLNTGFVASGTSNSIIGNFTEDPSSDNSGGIKEANTRVWTFGDVWVSKVGQPQYKTSSADPISFTVEFFFGNCKYPGYTE